MLPRWSSMSRVPDRADDKIGLCNVHVGLMDTPIMGNKLVRFLVFVPLLLLPDVCNI